MFKVVYNACYGGFRLSMEACDYLNNKYKLNIDSYYGFVDLPRHDKRLIKVIELMGDKANGKCAKLEIKLISSPVYRIREYDGCESVVTPDEEEWVLITQTKETKQCKN